jgi:hypothetical protein
LHFLSEFGESMAFKCISAGAMFALILSFASPANASLQSVLNGITVAPTPGVSSINAATDYIGGGADAHWSITGAGGSVATIIIELAGFAPLNKFGVYDASDPSKKVQIFSGVATTGDQAMLSIKADGSVFLNLADTGINFAGNAFGYYLHSPGGLFYSDTSLNSDSFDHMRAYQGNNVDTIQVPTLAYGLFTDNEYILAWEDLNGGGDQDYNDFVAIVESVHPVVPEATSMLIWAGLGFVGVRAAARRRERESS